jgi:hypothetical protein
MRVALLTSEKPILLATPKCGEGGSAAEGYPAANASTGEIHFLHLVRAEAHSTQPPRTYLLLPFFVVHGRSV